MLIPPDVALQHSKMTFKSLLECCKTWVPLRHLHCRITAVALLSSIFWCPEDYNACTLGMGCVMSDSPPMAVKQAGTLKSELQRMGSWAAWRTYTTPAIRPVEVHRWDLAGVLLLSDMLCTV